MERIDEETVFDDRQSNHDILKEFVEDQFGNRHIDFNLDMQIFTGLLYERFDGITIESKEYLNQGAFGEIFKVLIKELNSSRNVMKSPYDKSEKSIRHMFNEFKLVQNLNNHPHIIDYKYFVREKRMESGGS